MEEVPVVGTDEMKSLENWCHFPPIILKSGRCTHIPLADEEAMAKLTESDPTVDRFKAVNEDTKVFANEGWTSKVVGDNQSYNKIGGEGTISYAINVITSSRWPGAVTVGKGGQYCNIYVGDSLKRDSVFNTQDTPEVQMEAGEQEEQPEPNGKEKEPEKVEGEGEEPPEEL